MTSPLGQTFAPTGSADEELSKKPNAAQQAIQVLSMRLPRVKGARSISPLVGEPGSAARREVGGFSPDSAVLQTLMRSQAPTGTSEAMSAPMGSLPGASSMGARNPMAAAMAALGGGMMNAGPQQAPVITPGIADPNRPLPPIVPAPTPAPAPIPAPMPEPRDPFVPAPRIPQDDAPRDPWEDREPRQPGPAPAPVPPPAPAPPVAPPSPEPGVDPRMLRALMEMLGGGRGI